MGFNINSKKISERVDLVLSALTSIGSTRAAFVAWAAANPTLRMVGMEMTAEGLTYRYIGTGTAIADLPGWVPVGMIYARHFGSKEDYDQATQSGTDDYAAITAAIAYAASERSPGVAGGVVWITWRSLCSDTLVLPAGVWLRAVNPVSSYYSGQTAASTFPITFNEGSGFVFSNTAGPGILMNRSGARIKGMTIGATSARRNAAISTGAQNRNSGILMETDDLPNALIQFLMIDECLIRDQPADGIYGCGDLFNVTTRKNTVMNCGGHGIVFDDGTLSGRTNKDRPGEIKMDQDRIMNTGGHILVIGQVTAGTLLPYRVQISGIEGFRSGNTPAVMLKDAGYFINGEQVTVNGNAPAGGTGWTGSTEGLAYAVWVAGRNVHFNNCRFMGWVANPMCIGGVSGVATRDVVINGGYAAHDSPNVDYFAVVEVAVRGLVFLEPGGDFDIAPVDVAAVEAIAGGGYGEYTWGGQKTTWGMVYNNTSEYEWQIGGFAEMSLDDTRLFVAEPIRLGVDSTMPNGMGTTAPIGIQGTDATSTSVSVLRTSADSGSPAFRGGKRRAADYALNQSGDVASTFAGAAPNGTTFVDIGSMRVVTDNGSNAYGRLVFSTTGPAGSIVEAVRINSSQQVGIGTAGTISPAALLELASTTKGLLLPRMTTAERDAIGAPPDGLQIYNLTLSKFQGRAGGAWVDFH